MQVPARCHRPRWGRRRPSWTQHSWLKAQHRPRLELSAADPSRWSRMSRHCRCSRQRRRPRCRTSRTKRLFVVQRWTLWVCWSSWWPEELRSGSPGPTPDSADRSVASAPPLRPSLPGQRNSSWRSLVRGSPSARLPLTHPPPCRQPETRLSLSSGSSRFRLKPSPGPPIPFRPQPCDRTERCCHRRPMRSLRRSPAVRLPPRARSSTGAAGGGEDELEPPG